ncbi:MAG: SigB/SigF/SigG family RNA polymerase sigma factor [Solirubrobacteraceae bacterium]
MARTRHDRWLLDRMAAGDPHAREVLVERFLPLARKLARRYAGQDTYDDVLQVACLGLLKAIDGFDPQRSVAFTSYAVPTIVGELKRYFRDRTWAVRPPRSLLERALRIELATERMSESLHRAPSVDELASELTLTCEEVLEGLEAARAQHGTSLDATLDSDGEQWSRADLLGDVDAGFARAEDRVLVRQLSRALTERDHDILRLRFEQDMTQGEIGAQLGVSQMQVSRLIRGALDRLRVVAEHHEAMALA